MSWRFLPPATVRSRRRFPMWGRVRACIRRRQRLLFRRDPQPFPDFPNNFPMHRVWIASRVHHVHALGFALGNTQIRTVHAIEEACVFTFETVLVGCLAVLGGLLIATSGASNAGAHLRI